VKQLLLKKTEIGTIIPNDVAEWLYANNVTLRAYESLLNIVIPIVVEMVKTEEILQKDSKYDNEGVV